MSSTTISRQAVAWLLLISFLLQPFSSFAVTSPRFANYNNFLSSDYMLSRLSMDPQRVQKRLGDSFYYTTTTMTAGNTAMIQSGTDTNTLQASFHLYYSL